MCAARITYILSVFVPLLFAEEKQSESISFDLDFRYCDEDSVKMGIIN